MSQVPWIRISAVSLLTVVLGLSSAGFVGPWWGEQGWKMTLWQVDLTSSGVDYEIKWDDLCRNAGSSDDNGWCHRIRGARASMILTVAFCFGSLLCLLFKGTSSSKKGASCCDYNAVILAALSWFFMVAAIGISISFGVEVEETPAWGFILIIVAFPFSMLGMCFACCECCGVQNRKRGGGGKWKLYGQSPNGNYGGWGNWRPRRNTFRSPGGLASPEQGAIAPQGKPQVSYGQSVQGQQGHPTTAGGPTWFWLSPIWWSRRQQNTPLTMPQAPPHRAPQPDQALPGTPFGPRNDDFGLNRRRPIWSWWWSTIPIGWSRRQQSTTLGPLTMPQAPPHRAPPQSDHAPPGPPSGITPQPRRVDDFGLDRA